MNLWGLKLPPTLIIKVDDTHLSCQSPICTRINKYFYFSRDLKQGLQETSKLQQCCSIMQLQRSMIAVGLRRGIVGLSWILKQFCFTSCQPIGLPQLTLTWFCQITQLWGQMSSGGGNIIFRNYFTENHS